MSYRLFELHQQFRRVLSLNFPEPVWIRAELAAAKESNGHYFLELVEKDAAGKEVLARAGAVVWERQYRRIQRARGAKTMQLLRTGLELQLQVRVDFHERYGLQLFVEDIDPDFTYGRLARQREATLAELRETGLLDRNQALPLPLVCQRLAVISGRTAAGYEDFREQLLGNEYGYAFELDFFPAAVQGERAPLEIRQQLKHIGRRADRYDVVVIIRGGGGRLDLTAFDDAELCRAAATLPLPLLTGIGHETDESILDLVAHTRCKTPTAAAEWLLQRSLHYEMALLGRVRQLERLATQRIGNEQLRLAHLEQRLFSRVQRHFYQQERQLDRIETRLPLLITGAIDRATQRLDQYEQQLTALAPEAVLARGYALVSQGGKIITAAAQVAEGEALRIRLRQGEVIAMPEQRNDADLLPEAQEP